MHVRMSVDIEAPPEIVWLYLVSCNRNMDGVEEAGLRSEVAATPPIDNGYLTFDNLTVGY